MVKYEGKMKMKMLNINILDNIKHVGRYSIITDP